MLNINCKGFIDSCAVDMFGFVRLNIENVKNIGNISYELGNL